jgi:two-component system copper resistance phosphate regulon response regulator CusR
MRAYLAGEPTQHLLRVERIFLERGWQVDVAKPGDAGAGRYDIIVVEWAGSAPAMTSRIAELRRCVESRLVLLLGDFPLAERARGLPLGADDVIQHDAPGALIVSRLMALLRLRDFKDNYQVGELVVDMARRRVRRGGRDILLSQREFQLLVLLARDAGTVLPRSAIIEGLWAGNLDIGDNAVDALASRLRRRIDGPFRSKMLRTVRGVGYGLAVAEELSLAS